MEILDFCVQKLRTQEAEKFELCLERAQNLGIEIKEGKLDHLSRATDQSLTIRTLRGGRMGYSYTFDLSPDAVEGAIRTALEVGELMAADPHNDLPSFSAAHYQEIENFDATGLDVPLERKIELARELEAKALKHDPRIRRVRKAGYHEVSMETVLMDAAGEQIRHRETQFSAALLCVAEDGPEAEMGSDSRTANFLDQLLPAEVATTAAGDALELLHAGAAPTMTCSVVLKNSVTADLIGFLSASFSAENVDKNFSLLGGKKGSKFFSDKVTIVDDGLLPAGIATGPFDGEGTPSQTTPLIDQGVVAGFLYDGYYARKHREKSTASLRRRSAKAAPSIGPSNIYLKAGGRSRDALIGEVNKGVYITDLLGLHTANPVTGEFSVGASGILIENGRLTKPVKGFAIAGTLTDLFQQLSETGSDLRFWGGTGAPSALIARISVGGA